MHLKNIIRHLLLIIFSMTALQPHQLTAMGMPGMPGQGGPSLEDIRAMEAEIDNFVKTLPPEQQKQFYKDVEELTGIMEKMTPEELNEFVGSVFTDAGLVEPTPAAPAKPEPKPEPVRKEEAKPAVVITTAPSGPTEKAITMITKIINRTEEFMRKAHIIPEMRAKMDKWVVQKKLLDVTAALDWETVELQIDELNILMYALREQDHVTKQYKHIGNLIKDEALYNNLATLQVTLEAYVPLIFAPDFGLEKVSKESRAAIREVLSQYLESFYLLNIPTAVKKVISLYEPRAKELSEEEKKAAEQAKKEAEKTRRQAPGEKSAPAKPQYPTQPYSQTSNNYGYGYNPSSSYSSSYSPSSYDYGYPTSSSYASASPTPASGGGAGKAAGGGSGAGSSKEGKENEKPERGGGSEAGTPGVRSPGKEAAPKEEVDYEFDGNLQDISFDIRTAEKELKKQGDIFEKFKDHFIGADFEDDPTKPEAILKAIQTANESLKSATTQVKNLLKDGLKSANKATQDYYKKQLSNRLKQQIKFFDTVLKGVNDVKLIENYNNGSSFQPRKYYVYFGKGPLAATDPIRARITSIPVTMEQLGETIKAFVKEIPATEPAKP
jgi:septum formation inhibitor MinC